MTFLQKNTEVGEVGEKNERNGKQMVEQVFKELGLVIFFVNNFDETKRMFADLNHIEVLHILIVVFIYFRVLVKE